MVERSSSVYCVNEVIVIPGRRMLEEDKDYAVGFGILINTKGLKMIVMRRNPIEEGNYFDFPITSSLFGATLR